MFATNAFTSKKACLSFFLFLHFKLCAGNSLNFLDTVQLEVNKASVFGVMFQVMVDATNSTDDVSINITSFPIEIDSTNIEEIEVYTRDGELKYERSPKAWKNKTKNIFVACKGVGNVTTVHSESIELRADKGKNESYSFYVSAKKRLMQLPVYGNGPFIPNGTHSQADDVFSDSEIKQCSAKINNRDGVLILDPRNDNSTEAIIYLSKAKIKGFVNYCPSGVCGNSTDNARKRCNETCTVNADCNGDDECYDVSDTCYEFKCTKIDEIAETECNKRCNNFDDRMCDDGEECVNCHSCQLPENSPNQTCDESKACWRNSTNISINSCPAEEESCLPVPFPCPFNAPVPVATKSPTMVPSLEPTPEYKPPTIVQGTGCEIKFQCQTRYLDPETLEVTLTNSYVDSSQELNDEFESFENDKSQSNGIMFDVVALNRNISIRQIQLHLTEYAPVNVSVYATLYNDWVLSLDYTNGQPDFSEHYVLSYEGVRRHPTAWEEYTLTGEYGSMSSIFDFTAYNNTNDILLNPRGGVVPQLPYLWNESDGVFKAEITETQLRPICVLAYSSRGIYIHVNSGPSPLYFKYNENNIGDVYVTQGPDDVGSLIQLKIGIGLGKDKFYPPYTNGLGFSGLIRYNYALEEGQMWAQKGGQYSTIGVESSSCRQRSTSLLRNNFTLFGLLLILFIW